MTSAEAFAELLAVANSLTEAATAGELDTGYEISEAIIALPPVTRTAYPRGSRALVAARWASSWMPKQGAGVSGPK